PHGPRRRAAIARDAPRRSPPDRARAGGGPARPERLGEPVEIARAARDVALAIDISGSMAAHDVPGPDGRPAQRLAAVQDAARRFAKGREGDRAALIVFGSAAYLQAPSTEDLSAVTALLARTEAGMAGPHTALGDAIGPAIRSFEASVVAQRLLILLSDGMDAASRMSPVNAAAIAAERGVEIHAIDAGDPDASGEDRGDAASLQAIARRTGGRCFFAGDAAALEAVYARIDALTPSEVETLSWRPREALAWIPLTGAALVGLLATLVLHLGAARRARRRPPAPRPDAPRPDAPRTGEAP
ncbi:MAG: VWA domain-containing protein, partial [Pseudomonadota bacterium]|nr:VWA domain-containing protein [Pseudomonadota bacterium]